MFTTLDFEFFLKLLINTLSVAILIFGCYFRRLSTTETANRDQAISLFLFSIGVFVVTYLLHSVDISMGFAFGLFAVFSMLRYRTESISVKGMTYLFLVIAISLLSAVGSLNLAELITLNGSLALCTWLCEYRMASRSLVAQSIQYDKIEHIKPECHPQLIEDLRQRTGLQVQAVDIIEVDFLRDCAQLRVWHRLVEHRSAAEPVFREQPDY